MTPSRSSASMAETDGTRAVVEVVLVRLAGGLARGLRIQSAGSASGRRRLLARHAGIARLRAVGGAVLPAVGLLKVDDLAQQDAAVLQLVAPDHDGFEGQRALAQPRIIVSRPASMRLAMAISPSRESSSTEPISRRYIRTGSSVRS